ncbi:ferrochelatase [Wolbachia endosymbiont of Ctenocephalides felis wCfeJ]|uniref:ferrochelatase n=1 Tax=Wolbachia endosymbiont of Ctenocephalides felis wCfeJ TaxID=2732594 RepID=UPI001445EC1D|nr:ferrochelatase [Wolbachia endosymbiont of Ctenocephalides felis wCfeJ]WCR58206.1 MAG: Ferrochelatase [Wolbachia endosymbiont of Ctenocephalides felis wCfeJ]
MKKAIVLLNLGGPDSPNAVRPFLFNLFYDKRIINLPNPFRFLLAKFISAKREDTARKIYEQIGGKSPILENTKMQAEALEQELNKSVFCHPSSMELGSRKKNWIPASRAGMTQELARVFVCMRYWHPFANEVVESVKQFDPDEVILLPLYPQYSTTTTLSSIENWQKSAKKYGLKCNTKIINHYHNNQDFIEAHVNLTAQYYKLASRIGNPRILFSAHSLPLSVIEKGDPYALQIEETVKLIVERLNIKDLDWSICYQSKIGPVKWLEPSTEKELLRAKAEDIPVVLSPISFVSEHSETLVELDMEYKAIIKDGYYFRVPTLSTNSLFIKCLADLCRNCP